MHAALSVKTIQMLLKMREDNDMTMEKSIEGPWDPEKDFESENCPE